MLCISVSQDTDYMLSRKLKVMMGCFAWPGFRDDQWLIHVETCQASINPKTKTNLSPLLISS